MIEGLIVGTTSVFLQEPIDNVITARMNIIFFIIS